MKKAILGLTLISLVLSAYGQHDYEMSWRYQKRGNNQCDTRAQMADSVINYTYNSESGVYTPVKVTWYSYDDNYNLITTLSKVLPERVNDSRQTFYYDNDNNITKYVLQKWTDGEWADNLINERSYTPEGLPEWEVFLRLNTEGVFTPYQQHFYENENGRTTGYLRQVKNSAGEWYDFSRHYYVYDDEGRLAVLYGKYLSNGLIFWERTSVFDDLGLVSERYLKVLRYDPLLKQNVLTNDLYQQNSFNKYDNLVETRNFGFASGDWYLKGVDSTFYSMLPASHKVSVCHNGHTICVSVSALDAHLAHGDRIGSCDESETCCERREQPARNGEDHGNCFSIYPNPARNKITVKVEDDKAGYNTGVIMSNDGRVLKSVNIKGKDVIDINVSSLTPGKYLLTLISNKKADSRQLIIE